MVQAEGLTKRYRKAVAVEGLTFGVGPGEVYALLALGLAVWVFGREDVVFRN
ncbi:hypothetical protein TthAA37_20820 [Thermus thermophilus]|uniref:Uncharacterized protein n=1 Tax=Thermus thermophilus TaxID=274 RepID=A0AAD1KVW0_THETH|nr:hypothetical protein TthAA220_19920 [Thermus thermophilus]BBL85507.1 hypothetical protein TthAA229_19880 [Thermus thermophilus]BCZ87854.1 hypothetical protein TthAA11_20360 [Thermus thermophilus]BCZ90218.1 hypothetical protein TthAA22_20230 [Thermus thermophilus]BCZ92893.1 hypothetical protein TthAA37_20820 [Thermus thermophilus]